MITVLMANFDNQLHWIEKCLWDWGWASVCMCVEEDLWGHFQRALTMAGRAILNVVAPFHSQSELKQPTSLLFKGAQHPSLYRTVSKCLMLNSSWDCCSGKMLLSNCARKGSRKHRSTRYSPSLKGGRVEELDIMRRGGESQAAQLLCCSVSWS